MNHRRNRLSIVAVAALLALLLSACTIYIRPGETTVRGRLSFTIGLNDVITLFEPTRGEGASYEVGERIAFRIRTTESGYITLTAIDPDGSVYVFARNIFVEGGVTTVISGQSSRDVFVLVPPRGLHRVRASFTSGRTDTGRVTYVGRRGEDAWTNTITIEIRDFPVRDVAETSFFLR